MIPILQLLNKSIEQSIPLPEIFQYIDTKTTTLLFNNCYQECQILAYLNSQLPKTISTDSISIQFEKMNLIHSLISIIYHNRFQIQKRLNNFKENNKELIQLLSKCNREDTLLLIGSFESSFNLFTQSEVVWWKEIKLSFIKASLINIFNNGIIFPEFLYGVNYNQTINQYEIKLNKEMVKAMKVRNLFTQAVKQNVIEDQRLIAGLLRTIKLNDVNSEIQDKINSLLQVAKELRLKDDVSIQLIKMVSIKKQGSEYAEQKSLRKQGLKLIIQIYLHYALTIQLPIPEFIFSISISDCHQIIPHYRLMEALNQNYSSLKQLNDQFRLDKFVNQTYFLKQTDCDRLQQYFDSNKINKLFYYKSLLAMIKMVYQNSEKLYDSIFSIRMDERFHEIANLFNEINNRSIQPNNLCYKKCLEFVYKLYTKFDFILIEPDQVDDQNNVLEIAPKKIQKYKIMKSNQIKLFKLLVFLNQPHPELIKAIHFQKKSVKSKETIKQSCQITIKTGLWLMPVIFENNRILTLLTNIYENVKQQQLTPDELRSTFIEEELPEQIEGIDMAKTTIQTAIMNLVILFHRHYNQLEEKLRQTFTLRIINDFEDYLKMINNQQQDQGLISDCSQCLELLKGSLTQPQQNFIFCYD